MTAQKGKLEQLIDSALKKQQQRQESEKQKKTVKMSDGEASAIMAGAGYSLTNVLDAATAAIQAVINQQFEGKQ